MFIKNFSSLSSKDISIAGGKGASLGEMTQAGIPVPPGFVVLIDAFEYFLKEADIYQDIEAILDTVDPEITHTVEESSEKIQSIILSHPIPTDIEKVIYDEFKKLDTTYVAVRSSATAEDSSAAAWAGQLDSFLNTTEETLLENVKKCWASLFTPRAIFYRHEKNLHNQFISVAVVVQKMVESEKSGVAFSVHPVTEDENQLIIEAAYGLGEAIVSGQITPDSYVVEKDSGNILDINISEQGKGLFKKDAGGNEWKEIDPSQDKQQVLPNADINILSTIIIDIEKHYGLPCDIEWAYEKGEFYIVQSRPITTLLKNKKSKEKL